VELSSSGHQRSKITILRRTDVMTAAVPILHGDKNFIVISKVLQCSAWYPAPHTRNHNRGMNCGKDRMANTANVT
jgi:hypothetical protein